MNAWIRLEPQGPLISVPCVFVAGRWRIPARYLYVKDK